MRIKMIVIFCLINIFVNPVTSLAADFQESQSYYEHITGVQNNYILFMHEDVWHIKGDEYNNSIIEEIYCEPINEKYIKVLNHNYQYSIVDTNGNVILDDSYEQIEYIKDDKFIVAMDSKWYIVDACGKRISDIYDDMFVINDSFIACSKDKLYGVINILGAEVLPFEYSGIASQPVDTTCSMQYLVVLKDGINQVINIQGNTICTLDRIPGRLSEDKMSYLDNDRNLCYINSHGKIQFCLDEKVNYIDEFSDNMAIIKCGDSYTYIDDKGNIGNEYFDKAYKFYNGIALVANYIQKEEIVLLDWYIIDKSLNIVYDIEDSVFETDRIDENFKEGYIITIDQNTNKMSYIIIGNDDLTFQYISTEQGIKITNYIGSDEYVTIPAYINNQTVTEIAAGTFDNKNVKSITFPNKNVIINSATINNCSSLKHVYIPNADTIIVDGAISNCPNVTITGKSASTANIYAITNNIAFRATSTQTARISDVVTDNATGTVHATITNTSGKDFNNIQAIVALYSNGKMTDAKTYDIEKLPDDDSVGISVKVNTNNIYEYKIFLWESLQTIKPISDVYVPDGIMKSTVSATPTPTKKYDVSVSNVVTNIGAKTISATVKNSGNDNISDAVVYVAAYDNGKLLEAQRCDVSSLNAGLTQNITATFKTKDIDDYKIFVWTSESTLQPISSVYN